MTGTLRDEVLRLLEIEMVKNARSWHMKMTRKIIWPLKRLIEKRKLLREPTKIKVLENDCEVKHCVEDGGAASLQGLDKEIDLWDEMNAIVEEWQEKGGIMRECLE